MKWPWNFTDNYKFNLGNDRFLGFSFWAFHEAVFRGYIVPTASVYFDSNNNTSNNCLGWWMKTFWVLLERVVTSGSCLNKTSMLRTSCRRRGVGAKRLNKVLYAFLLFPSVIIYRTLPSQKEWLLMNMLPQIHQNVRKCFARWRHTHKELLQKNVGRGLWK